MRTSQNLTALQERHSEDTKQSDEHDERIRNELAEFMAEIKKSISHDMDLGLIIYFLTLE